jgi:hypothetical protein
MIQSIPEDIEQIRERIRKMSDLELRKYGRAARELADPKKNHGKPNPSFQVQLDEARAEWRRRHPPNKSVRNNRLPESIKALSVISLRVCQ